MARQPALLLGIYLTALAPGSASATAMFFTDESLFNAAIGGATLSSESFESTFVGGTTSIAFAELTVTGDENLIRVNPSTLATDGMGTIGIVDNAFNGNHVTFSFASPVNAVSLDILAALDVSSSGTLTLSNDTGASQLLFSAPLPLFSMQFAGLVDTMTPFSSITITATQTGDGIQFDRLRFAFIPEPATFLTLGAGLLVVVAHRRRTPRRARR